MSYPSPNEIYRAAVVAERTAWDAVRDKLPGSPDFDQSKWDRWRSAMTAVVHAMDGMRSPRQSLPKDDWTLHDVVEGVLVS